MQDVVYKCFTNLQVMKIFSNPDMYIAPDKMGYQEDMRPISP